MELKIERKGEKCSSCAAISGLSWETEKWKTTYTYAYKMSCCQLDDAKARSCNLNPIHLFQHFSPSFQISSLNPKEEKKADILFQLEELT